MSVLSRPGVGVGVAICSGDQVLLGRRKGNHQPGVWGFPGGHMEFGESFEATAIREVEEETGLILPSATYWCVENTIYHNERKHYVVVFMVAQAPKGQLLQQREDDKHEAWRWYRWDDLPCPLMLGIAKLVAAGRSPFDVILAQPVEEANHE